MAEKDTYPLRIYCICGQKMKVSEAMLGQPGKCVACRQKLRIPRLDELPEGTTEVDLTEAPQFLRKRRARPPEDARRDDAPERTAAETTLEADDETGLRKDVAPAILEPLRTLASMEHRVRHRLARAEAGSEDRPEAAEYRRILEGIQDAREHLDDLLRQRLMETSVELSGTLDRISKLTLSARVGEVEVDAFREQIAKHRRRRDCLEQRQINLRGWLAVRTPHEAGGYIRIPLDAEPPLVERIDFPDEPGEHSTLRDWWIRELRDALEVREAARKERQELRKQRNRRDADRTELGHRLAAAKAALTRAEARLAFCRERLSTLEDDIAKDMQTADSLAERLDGRRRPTEAAAALVTGGPEAKLESWRAQLQEDNALVHKALQATDARSVPTAAARPRPNRYSSVYLRNVTDAWLAWGAGILAALALLLPAFGDVSPLAFARDLRPAAPEAHWVVTIPVAAAVASALVACVPGAAARGLGYLAVWVLAGLGAILFVHEGASGFTPLAEPLRQAIAHPGRPGALALLSAYALLGAAAVVALRKRPRLWSAVAGAVIIIAAWIGLVSSDFLGFARPAPTVSEVTRFDPASQQYEGAIWVTNEGIREMALTAATPRSRAFTYALERRETDGWTDVGPPSEVEANEMRFMVRGSALPDLRIGPGRSAVLRYRLDPGRYRVRLNNEPAHDFDLTRQTTAVAREPDPGDEPGDEPAPIPPAAPPARTDPTLDAALRASDQADEPRDGSAGAEGVVDWTSDGVEVQLRGILVAAEKNPRFTIDVYLPDGSVRTRSLFLGAPVHGTWYVAEFNPDTRSVTLSNEERLLVLYMEDRLPLDEDLSVLEKSSGEG